MDNKECDSVSLSTFDQLCFHTNYIPEVITVRVWGILSKREREIAKEDLETVINYEC